MSGCFGFLKACSLLAVPYCALMLLGGAIPAISPIASAHAEVSIADPMFDVIHDPNKEDDASPPIYVEMAATNDPVELDMRAFADYGRALMADYLNQTISSWGLDQDKRQIVDWYFTEALRREALVREVTDPLYKFKNTFGKSEMDGLIRVRIMGQIQADVEDGYAKAPDIERQEYITKTLKLMDAQPDRNCRFKYVRDLPMVDSAESEIFAKMVEHLYMVNSPVGTLQSFLEQRLTFTDYHLDKNRVADFYRAPPQDTKLALQRFLKKAGIKDNVLEPMGSKFSTEYSDREVCNAYKVYFAVIRDLPGNEGKSLRQKNFPR